MKIVSYNINGLRASMKLGLDKFIKENDFDVLCFQEVRAGEEIARNFFETSQTSIFDDYLSQQKDDFSSFYKFYNCGKKAGYAGTMVLSKIKPIKVLYDMGDIWKDDEGRTTTLFFDDLIVVNAYIPNGNSRLEFKMQYLEALTEFLSMLKENSSVVCVGDFNIANEEIDLTNPKECKNKSVFLPIERSAFKEILKLGYIDTFRFLYPQKVEYSWRSYRSRQENLLPSNYNSWKYRIDYAIFYNNDSYIINSCQMPDLIYSDHLPVILEIRKKVNL